MINILFLTISFFLLVFLESFLLKVFSFSLFVVLVISVWNRIDSILFYIFIIIFTIILDTVFHLSLGVHMISIALLVLLVQLFWVFIPRDDRFGFIPVFFFTFFYYLLVPIFNSFLLDRIFPKILPSMLISIGLKSVISVLIYIGISKLLELFRDSSKGGKIRLR
jgi:hypothetical protein